ncbi:hypothetical protein [Sphingomonas sp.]|uniref:hypothetical protein n=1 Tax=Sphingomonas sp. TaxID=28214 RepID=UPI003B00A3AD
MADIKNNLSATTDPAGANDSSQGYAVGSTWWHKTDGVLWECTDATTGAALWVRVNGNARPWGSHQLRTPDYISSWSATQCAADTLVMFPMTFQQKMVVDGIGIRCTVVGSAGAAARLGIYRHDQSTGLPAARKADLGEIALDSGTGNKTITLASLQYFDPGIWWLACVLKGVATMPTLMRAGAAVSGAVPVGDGLDPFTNNPRYVAAAFPYAALPGTAPTMAYSTGVDGVGLYLRKA